MSLTASAPNLLVALASGGTPHSNLAFSLTSCQGYQNVSVTSSAGPVGFTIPTPYQSPYWLTVTGLNETALPTTAPALLEFSIGYYPSTNGPLTVPVTITPTSGNGTPATVTVTYSPFSGCGGSAGTIALSPPSLNLSATTTSGTLTLSNGTASSASYTAASDSSWLTVSPTSGSLDSGSNTMLTVTASAAGLGNGDYTGHVNVSSGGTAVATASVTFAASGNSGTLTAHCPSTPNVSWSFTTGSTLSPGACTLQSSSGAATYTAAVNTVSGGNWLLANLGSGGSARIADGLRLDLSSVGQGLATGTYQGTVTLTASDGSTATVSVTLTVNGGLNSTVTISPSTSSSFSAASGSTSTQSASFTVQASGGTTLSAPTASTSNGGQWLTITNTPNGSSYEAIGVTVNPSGLADGIYTGGITVPTSAGNGSITLTLVVGTGGANTLSGIAPGSLSFSYQLHGPNLNLGLMQYVAVTGSVGNFAATVDQTWLSLTGSSGTSPGKIGVYVSPGTLTAGSYNGNVIITATASGAVTRVPVSLAITASGSPVLGIFPQGDAVISYPGDSSFTQSFTLTTSDGSSLSATAVASASTPWLTAALSGANLAVTANGGAYPTGTYSGTVTITASGYANSPLVMPVVMVVNGGGGTAILSFSQLNPFSVTPGGASQSQNLTVYAPNATTGYTVTAYTPAASGATWLSTSPTSGSTLYGNQTVAVTVTPGALPAGTYYGSLSFNTSGNIETVPVTMVVSGGGPGNVTVTNGSTTNPNLSLSFTSQAGGSAPGSQKLTVNSAQGASGIGVTLSISPGTTTWLSASFLNGASTAITSADFNVSVNPAGLSPNTYTASVVATPNGGTAVTIPVTLVVQAAPTVSASSSGLTFTYQAGTNAPSPGIVSVSGGGANLSFTATAATSSGGNWLSVSPLSGNTGTGGTTVSVAVNPASLSAGSYSGTVTVAGSNGAGGSTAIPVSLTVTVPLPTIARILNAASFAAGAVSPGEIIAIFAPSDGTHPIGPATAANLTSDVIVNGKLPTTLGGVQVLFNGYPAPVYYASASQVNAIVPYEIASVQSPTVWVKFLGQTSNTFALTAAPTAPAIFTANGSGTGPAALVNAADDSFNAPNNPAAKGSTVVFFVTGEGVTSPASATGQVTTLNSSGNGPLTPQPLLRLGVTIDGQPAAVLFYGETPGVVAGLLQLNVQIPAGARTGDLPLAVNIGGNYSQNGVTVSVK